MLNDDTGIFAAKLRAPFAVLGVRTDGHAVTRLTYLPLDARAQPPTDEVAEQVVRELKAYFADPEFRFTVPLAPTGTPFQRRVWRAIEAIPRWVFHADSELPIRIRSPAS